ncbi:pectate lyase superfamily protein-domain-containing protein [Chaetomium strumarium]|uniref:Pectate lyase superfamily protein-domain-containing protein n=1 Tax=Chaetomium strumarium TaxID=1170767 RepID=A0AAJ0GP09_9PEZI|nr:pectate lyase superfamily protein-domain-containing protein [Chaetomium strumarium]
MRFLSALLAAASLVSTAKAHWLGDIKHQGYAPFTPSGYPVFRNVKDYGARGDGVTDDTAAIMAAVNAGNPCNRNCASTTMTPALVYFPAGTYLISSSIKPAYFTQLFGDAANPPTLKATANFAGFGLIDGNPYYTDVLNWKSVNVFFRQIRNFIIDTTNIPAATAATGIHWPTAQATSLQNIVFNMPTASDVVHVGLFLEEGSGGFMTDLTFNGGATGASMGNQQFTMRNLKFNNCKTAIIQIWNWGWTYHGLSINNCQVGIDISAGGSSALNVGSVTLLDSSFTNTPVAILTAWTPSANPDTAGSLVMENIALSNVPVAVKGPGGTMLAGSTGSATIAAWSNGHRYTPSGPVETSGAVSANARPAALLSNGRFYTRSKPQYENLPASSFVSARSAGARGDGATDDTAALQNAINSAVAQGKVLFLDYGLYRVTSTIRIPPGAKVVGESFPVILSAGAFFNDINNPRPVLQVGSTSGQPGQVELSDFLVGTQNAQAGAVCIEWNLATTGAPSGMWDVHVRIGGFTGSQQQVAQCLKQPGSAAVNQNCIVAYMAMHVTKQASNLYMENVWLWTADHDIDDAANTQITIYSGRGLYIESQNGPFWLWGTGSEHHVLYQYQLANTRNIFMGQIQTETAYFQPTPNALVPFSPVASLNDPDFAASCAGVSGNCANGWGLRVINSQDVLVYGAGLYSFFNNYSTACSTFAAGQTCQQRIASIEGSATNVNIYNLNTIGTREMLNRNGARVAWYADNVNTFASNIAVYKSG